MLYAKKLNRVYKVNEAEQATYLKRGFDIVDEKGTLIKAAEDKTISYNEHIKEMEALKAENETLKDELSKANEVPKNAKELKTKVDELIAENEALKAENETLTTQITNLTEGEANDKVQEQEN